MQRVILHGGLKALAAPRGDGKSTKIIRACNWALSYGYRSFIVMIASETDKGEEDLLAPLKMEWETNDLLLEDFPESRTRSEHSKDITTAARVKPSMGTAPIFTGKIRHRFPHGKEFARIRRGGARERDSQRGAWNDVHNRQRENDSPEPSASR